MTSTGLASRDGNLQEGDIILKVVFLNVLNMNELHVGIGLQQIIIFYRDQSLTLYLSLSVTAV